MGPCGPQVSQVVGVSGQCIGLLLGAIPGGEGWDTAPASLGPGDSIHCTLFKLTLAISLQEIATALCWFFVFCFCFCFVLAAPRGLQDLSSPTRDPGPGSESAEF